MRDKTQIRKELAQKQERLEYYLAREREMLTGGAQSYGIGSRNVTRYTTELAEVRRAIAGLETEIRELRGALAGQKPRLAVGVIPRDW